MARELSDVKVTDDNENKAILWPYFCIEIMYINEAYHFRKATITIHAFCELSQTYSMLSIDLDNNFITSAEIFNIIKNLLNSCKCLKSIDNQIEKPEYVFTKLEVQSMKNKHQEQAHLAEGKSCILFVHGILSSPSYFNSLIADLPSNLNYLNVLLPGHGASLSEFSSVGMSDWDDYCAKKLKYLRALYENIVVVGHSMGNLLLIDELIKDKSNISGAVLIDVPLIGHVTKSGIDVMLKAVFDAEKKNDSIDLSVKYNKSIQFEHYYDLPYFLPNFIQLLWKMHQVRMHMADMDVESDVFQSEKDELVSDLSNRYIEQNKRASLHTMPNVGHFYIPDAERAKIAAAIMKYYNKGEA